MSGGVDSSTAAAMLARAGETRGGADAAALGSDAARRQAWDSGCAEGGALLLARRCVRRAARGRAPGDSLLRGQPGRAVRARRGAAVCG